MIKNYNQTLPGLEHDIIMKVYKLQKRKLLLRQSAYGIISGVSLIGVISSGIYAFKTLLASGVYGYVSLIFTDIQSLSYWKELSLSIAESLPFLALATCFGVCAVFLWSAVKTARIQVFKNALI